MKKLTLMLVLISLHSACSRYYYQPNSVNVPMLNERNDLNVTLNGTWGDDEVNGSKSKNHVLNVQAAYSPVKYLGIIAGYSGYAYHVKNDPDVESGHVNADASLFEAGIGGYYPIYSIKEGMTLIADGYVGYGGGSLKSDVNMDVSRLFFQPGINLRTAYFDFGFQGRFSGVKFNNLNANGRSEPYLHENGLSNITDDRNFFFEPAVTLRGGYKFIKFQIQHVWSNPMKSIDWNHNDNLTTIGLFFSVDDLLRFRNKD